MQMARAVLMQFQTQKVYQKVCTFKYLLHYPVDKSFGTRRHILSKYQRVDTQLIVNVAIE